MLYIEKNVTLELSECCSCSLTKRMKRISIEVREDFILPQLYQVDESSSTVETCMMREVALVIGANAVRDVLDVHKNDTRHMEASKRIEQLEQSLKRHREASHQLSTIQQEHDAQITRLRTEAAAERARIRDNVDAEAVAKAKRDAEEKFREALLVERERHATEREAIITRLEERHADTMALESQRSFLTITELRTSLQTLRTEHEGLVLKLMTRLEPVSTRAGSSAAALGRTFEESVQRHLREAFGARDGFHLEDVHAVGHCGDLLMVFDGLRILIELKSYDPKTRVPTKEVEKLARDLAEVQPRCDAAIMISACSEITGHYACGPLEVSGTVACVPVLFINNFLSLGEPLVTLHMTRVFLTMVNTVAASQHRLEEMEIACASENREAAEVDRFDRMRRSSAECARRCTGYLADLARQSTGLLREVTSMKNSAIKLREAVIALVESEVARFNGLVQLMSHCDELLSTPVEVVEESTLVLDRTVFNDPVLMTPVNRELAAALSLTYDIGDHRQSCATKELLASIQALLKIKSDKTAREALRSVFLEAVIKHGYVMGITKKASLIEEAVSP